MNTRYCQDTSSRSFGLTTLLKKDVSMMRWFWRLLYFRRARRLHFSSRQALEAFQSDRLKALHQDLPQLASFYKERKDIPISEWSRTDKRIWRRKFDEMNTVGAVRKDVEALASKAEAKKKHHPHIHGCLVGFSGGSGKRSVFLRNAREQGQWAAQILAHILPAGDYRGMRLAVLIGPGGNLYHQLRLPRLRTRCIDLDQSFGTICASLKTFRPTLLMAPKHVLCELARKTLNGEIRWMSDFQVISYGEVLSSNDRDIITRAFGAPQELYVSHIGLLAATCEYGAFHLNESAFKVEREWIDEAHRRFVPVVTDIERRSQPVVRYRVNDMLLPKKTPCRCGRVTAALIGIEGRSHDVLRLPGLRGHQVLIYPHDVIAALNACLPLNVDYRLVQKSEVALHLQVKQSAGLLRTARSHLRRVFLNAGVDIRQLQWTMDLLPATFDTLWRQRRIQGWNGRRRVAPASSSVNAPVADQATDDQK
jgi:putative adenylate-forming enzyme